MRCFRTVLLFGIMALFCMNASYSAAGATTLKDVIEGAKKEGTLVFFGAGEQYNANQIAEGIKNTFGVDLKVTTLPGRQTEAMAKVAMEIQAGLQPSYDLFVATHTNIMSVCRPKELLADVDWPSLINEVNNLGKEGVKINPHDYIPKPADYFVESGYVQTIIYNPEKIDKKDLPKSFAEMTDPKWKGKFGWLKYPVANAEVCYFLGMPDDKGVQFIRDIMKNKPVLESFDAMTAKMAMGEVAFAVMGSQELTRLQQKDPNCKLTWEPIGDFTLVMEIPKLVIKGAKNINAAILTTLWFGTPAGQALQKSYGSSIYTDPTTNDYRIVQETEKRGNRVIYASREKAYSEWLSSSESLSFVKKVNLALKGH